MSPKESECRLTALHVLLVNMTNSCVGVLFVYLLNKVCTRQPVQIYKAQQSNVNVQVLHREVLEIFAKNVSDIHTYTILLISFQIKSQKWQLCNKCDVVGSNMMRVGAHLDQLRLCATRCVICTSACAARHYLSFHSFICICNGMYMISALIFLLASLLLTVSLWCLKRHVSQSM